MSNKQWTYEKEFNGWRTIDPDGHKSVFLVIREDDMKAYIDMLNKNLFAGDKQKIKELKAPTKKGKTFDMEMESYLDGE